MADEKAAEQSASEESAVATEATDSTIVARGVKIAGETLVAPGSSLLLDGKIVSGGVHLVGGLVGRALLGPIGWGLVAANSYTKSVTGKSLLEQIGSATADGK